MELTLKTWAVVICLLIAAATPSRSRKAGRKIRRALSKFEMSCEHLAEVQNAFMPFMLLDQVILFSIHIRTIQYTSMHSTLNESQLLLGIGHFIEQLCYVCIVFALSFETFLCLSTSVHRRTSTICRRIPSNCCMTSQQWPVTMAVKCWWWCYNTVLTSQDRDMTSFDATDPFPIRSTHTAPTSYIRCFITTPLRLQVRRTA